MTVPAIRNFELRPPAGGWSLSITVKGQVFHFSGGWRPITQGIAEVQRDNEVFISMDAVFAYCNGVWCARDPGRCMNPAQRSQAQKRVGCSTCGKMRNGARRRIR